MLNGYVDKARSYNKTVFVGNAGSPFTYNLDLSTVAARGVNNYMIFVIVSADIVNVELAGSCIIGSFAGSYCNILLASNNTRIQFSMSTSPILTITQAYSGYHNGCYASITTSAPWSGVN